MNRGGRRNGRRGRCGGDVIRVQSGGVKGGVVTVAAIRSSAAGAALEAADDAAAVEHHRAVADPGDLLDVGGEHQHGKAAVGECPQFEIDLAARADIDAAGRLLEDEELRRRRPASATTQTFCWLPPESVRIFCSGPRVRMPRPSIQCFAWRSPGACETKRPSHIAVLERRHHVLAHGQLGDDAFLLAVGGDEADAGAFALGRRMRPVGVCPTRIDLPDFSGPSAP